MFARVQALVSVQAHKTWLADRHRGGISSCLLRGELPCLRGSYSLRLSFGSWWAMRCGLIVKRLWLCKRSPRGQLEQLEICVSGSLEHSYKSSNTILFQQQQRASKWLYSGFCLISDAKSLCSKHHARCHVSTGLHLQQCHRFSGFYFILYTLILLSQTQ